MWSQRPSSTTAWQRRATLERCSAAAATPTDVCDAHPYLLPGRQLHGEATGRDCPVCRREPLVELSYTFGDELGQYSGRIKSPAELALMAHEHGEFRVYVVEVCQGCGWNHLTRSYVLGDGVAAGRRAGRAGRRQPVARHARSRLRHRPAPALASRRRTGPAPRALVRDRLPPRGAYAASAASAVAGGSCWRSRRRLRAGLVALFGVPYAATTCPQPNDEAPRRPRSSTGPTARPRSAGSARRTASRSR